jgi:RsmE family RNA methyltransferase
MTLGQAIGHTEGMVRILMHESRAGADAPVGPLTDSSFPKIHKTSQIALFVGPEGGFTEEEVAAAESAGAHIVTMGELVLRAETAAVAGVTKIRFS